MSEKLMKSRLSDLLSVSIKFEKLVEHRGFCEFLDDDISPRMFLITLDDGLKRKTILKTLAHELVHVKQFARNELRKFDANDRPIYLGKTIKLDKIEYWEYPWEIEAHGREIGLYTMYNDTLQKDIKLRNKLRPSTNNKNKT